MGGLGHQPCRRHVLLGKSSEGICRMHHDLITYCEQRGFSHRDDKLCLWRNFPGDPVRLGGRTRTAGHSSLCSPPRRKLVGLAQE